MDSTKTEASLLTEQETLSSSGSAGPAGAVLRAELWNAGGWLRGRERTQEAGVRVSAGV